VVEEIAKIRKAAMSLYKGKQGKRYTRFELRDRGKRRLVPARFACMVFITEFLATERDENET